MVNYSQGKIYKIEPICDCEEGDTYIGSTAQDKLCQRWRQHKVPLNKTKCSILIEKYGAENCHIVLIENVNANSKEELLAREAFYIRNIPCVNKKIPGRTVAMWYEDNKEILCMKQKQYYKKNPQALKERNKKYRENNQESIKAKSIQFRITNRDVINETQKQSRIKKKQKIKEQKCLEYKLCVILWVIFAADLNKSLTGLKVD